MGLQNIISFSLMDIGEEIRKARRSLDITQKELADMVTKRVRDVKLSQREVSLLEKGKGNPTMNKIEAIALVLDKSWILLDNTEE